MRLHVDIHMFLVYSTCAARGLERYGKCVGVCVWGGGGVGVGGAVFLRFLECGAVMLGSAHPHSARSSLQQDRL